MVVSIAASQAGDPGLDICYCLFPHGPEAQNVDVSASQDGRLRTSVYASLSPLQAGKWNGGTWRGPSFFPPRQRICIV